MDGQESLVKFLLLLVMPRPAWTSDTSFCSSAPFLSSAFLILAPAAPTPFSPRRPSWGSVPTLWWWGMVVVRERDAGCQASLLLKASWSRAPRGRGQRHLLSTSSPTWSLPRSIPSMCGPTQQRVPARTRPPATLPAWAAVSNSFSSPVEPLASGKQNCQPAHLVSSAAPAALGFPTKALNVTSVQASWELPLQLGSIQGFNLFHRKLPAARFEGPLLLASTVSSFLYTDLGEALSEIQLQAFSGHGDGKHSSHVVSRHMCPWPPPVSGIW